MDAEKNSEDNNLMSAEQFIIWRKGLGLKQKEAAELLGLQKRMIQYYEKGKRDNKPVVIPKSIRLACYALQQGINDFDGENVFHSAAHSAAIDKN